MKREVSRLSVNYVVRLNYKIGWAFADLFRLLDFSATTSHADIDSRLRQIASVLLHDYHLVCSSANSQCTFEVLEIEFYLIKPPFHEDPFAHGSEDQKRSGRW